MDFSDDEHDSISLCSTTWTELRSDYGEGKEYYVDKILAQLDDGEEVSEYLLLWEGYADERATWEKAETVPEKKILDWLEHLMRVEKGISKDNFDVEKWERTKKRTEITKKRRKERRARKRSCLGITEKYRPGQRPAIHKFHDSGGPNEQAETDEDPLFEPPRAHPQPLTVASSTSSAAFVPNPTSTVSKPNEPADNAPSSSTRPAQPTVSPNKPIGTVGAPARPAVTMGAKKAGAVRKSNVFVNFNEHKERKRRGVGAAKPIRDPEHRDPKSHKVLTTSQWYKINKANRSEKAPLPFEQLQDVYRRPSMPFVPPVAEASTTAAASATDESPMIITDTTQPPLQSRSRGMKEKTCFFWAHLGCNKSDEECGAAHEFLATFTIPPRWNGRPPMKWPTSRPEASGSKPSGSEAPKQPARQSTWRPSVPANASPPPAQAPPPPPSTPSFQARLTTQAFAGYNINLSTTKTGIPELLMATRGPNPELAVTFATTAENFRNFLSSNSVDSVTVSNGTITFTDTVDNYHKGLAEYHDHVSKQAVSLGSSAGASVIVHKHFAIIIYAASDAASFKDTADHDMSGHHLCFQLIAPLDVNQNPPSVNVYSPNENTGELQSFPERFVAYVYRIFGGIFMDDVTDMFIWTNDGKRDNLDHRLFLRFGEHHHERDLAATLFDPHVQVNNSDERGAWTDFVKDVNQNGKNGVIVFHPSEWRYSRVPHLSYLLHEKINFYVLGAAESGLEVYYNTFMPMRLRKIFKTGTATCIAAKLYEDQPERALRVLKLIVKNNEKAGWGEKKWKLFDRHHYSHDSPVFELPSTKSDPCPKFINIEKWLMELAEKGKREGESRERVLLRAALWDEITDHLWPLMMRIPFTWLPSPDAAVITLPDENWVSNLAHGEYQGWSIEEIEFAHFKQWAVSAEQSFRRFVMVVSEVNAEYVALKEKYQNVEVVTPQKYIDRYGRWA